MLLGDEIPGEAFATEIVAPAFDVERNDFDWGDLVASTSLLGTTLIRSYPEERFGLELQIFDNPDRIAALAVLLAPTAS